MAGLSSPLVPYLVDKVVRHAGDLVITQHQSTVVELVQEDQQKQEGVKSGLVPVCQQCYYSFRLRVLFETTHQLTC